LAYLVPLDVDVTGNITVKICEVWSEFNIFSTLVTMATATILNLFNLPKSCHTLRWIFLQSFMKFDERNPKIFETPLFCFHGNCDKVCPTNSDFLLAYLVPLDVDVVPIKFHQFMLGEYPGMIIFVFFQFFCILAISMAMAAI
jgi:hypothetical protein